MDLLALVPSPPTSHAAWAINTSTHLQVLEALLVVPVEVLSGRRQASLEVLLYTRHVRHAALAAAAALGCQLQHHQTPVYAQKRWHRWHRRVCRPSEMQTALAETPGPLLKRPGQEYLQPRHIKVPQHS